MNETFRARAPPMFWTCAFVMVPAGATSRSPKPPSYHTSRSGFRQGLSVMPKAGHCARSGRQLGSPAGWNGSFKQLCAVEAIVHPLYTSAPSTVSTTQHGFSHTFSYASSSLLFDVSDSGVEVVIVAMTG